MERPGMVPDIGVDVETPIFAVQPAGLTAQLETLNLNAGRPLGQRLEALAAANGSLMVALAGGDLVRWYPSEDEVSLIDFGRDRCTEICRVLLDPKGFHSLVTSTTGDTWYLNFQDNKAKHLPKLKGHDIEAVSWDADSTNNSTKDLVVGTMYGQILHLVISDGKERAPRPLFAFDLGDRGRVPVCGVIREKVVSAVDGLEKTVVFAAAGCAIYAFVGPALDTLFQRYQGENGHVRALVYEVPRDSPHGDLQVNTSCVGTKGTKVLFWHTGVGVLAAEIRNPLEADNAVLETPPGLIPFPRPMKGSQAAASRGSASAGGLMASLLPPPPPPAPLSMALTRYHIVFIFEDRWAVVSRITHEVVQQQEWDTATHGNLRGLANDQEYDVLWLRSERHLFELTIDREERNAWTLFMKQERFDDAMLACKRAPQQAIVRAAQADKLFKKGELVEAARKFAEAKDVPFEHVALRFLGAGKKAALLEYFRCRLKDCPSEEKVTRALLGVWAVEIALARLNELRLQANSGRGKKALAEEQDSLHELLKDLAGRSLDVHATIYHLLQSHGWLKELAIFAEARRDFTTVTLHHVSRRDCEGAIRKLTDFARAGGTGQGDEAPGELRATQDLVCRFAPVLFGAEPRAFVSLLVQQAQLSAVDPLSVLPAVYAPRASPTHRAEAIRYLEHVVRHHPELVGQANAAGASEKADGVGVGPLGEIPAGGQRKRSLLLDSGDLALGEEEPGPGAAGAASGSFGWASGTAILNALTMLYVCDCGSGKGEAEEEAETNLLRFLQSQESNPLLDPQFALQICGERGLARAVVLLYGIMGMHEEAVDAALKRGDVGLAKHNACKPADKRLRQKLWLRIIESQAASGDVQQIAGLIRESQELSVRDVLPYMSDSMTIDAFQVEICDCLDSYEQQIVTLRQEMDDHRRALQAFKQDLQHAEERQVVISREQVCEICGSPAISERFYVFACRHCFHEACLRALVVPVLSAERGERLFALEATRLDYQARAAGAAPSASGSPPAEAALAEVEDELDGILADDCPLCGHLMIDTIKRPFVDPWEEAEVASWAF